MIRFGSLWCRNPGDNYVQYMFSLLTLNNETQRACAKGRSLETDGHGKTRRCPMQM